MSRINTLNYCSYAMGKYFQVFAQILYAFVCGDFSPNAFSTVYEAKKKKASSDHATDATTF